MDTASTKLHDRLAALEQENATLRSRLESCERSHAVLQAEVARYRQPNQDGQAGAKGATTPELASTCSSSLEQHLLETTAEVARALLTLTPLDAAVNTALRMIGEALDTDRVILIENFASPSDSAFPGWRVLEYEWTSPGTAPQFTDQGAAQGSYEDFPEFFERLRQGQTTSYLIETAPEPFRSAQIAIGVKSTHVVPIFVKGQWWGVLGLDDCREAKQRSAAELAVLKIAADCIGSAIERDRTQQALLQDEQERKHSAAKHSQELERINSELQQTLDRLAESEKRYRTLFELSSEGIVRWEYEQPIPITLSVDEQLELCYESIRIAEVNNALAQMYEYQKAEDLIGLTPKEFHDRNSDVIQAAMRAWIENGYTCQSLETEEIDRYGRKRYFLNSAVSTIENDCVTSTWISQIDITELRETQQALLQAEQKRSQELERLNTELQRTLEQEIKLHQRLVEAELRYSTLFKLSNEGIYRFEFEQPISILLSVEEQFRLMYQHWRLAEANHSYAQQYGMSHPDSLIGMKMPAPSLDSEKNRAANRTVIENGYRLQNAEAEENVNGQPRFFLHNLVCDVRDGYVFGGWGIQTDVTELRETQQALLETEQARVAELAKANEELQQRDRELQRSYRRLSTVAQVTKDLLEAEDVDVAIPIALQAVGELANISRVQLLLERREPSTQKLQHIVAYEWAAQGIIPQINHPDAAVLDNDNFEFMLQDLHTGRSIWHIVEGFPSPVQEKFEAIGIKSCGAVPIFIEGRYIGSVGFDDCIMPRQWSQQEIDVLTTAAESIGAALHRKQLVDRLVEERTKAAQERVAELAKANEALKRSVDVLATETNLNQFIGHVLRLAAEQFNAPLAEYWETTNPNIGKIVGWWGHNQIHGLGRPHNHPASKSGVRVPSHMLEQGQFSDLRKHFVAPFDHSVQPVEGTFSSDPASWYASFGVSWQLNLPLIVGETCFGVLNFWQPSDRPFTEQQIELGYALAQQVTLAIRLSQLAEEAKQAAIAREQEKAAQERAAELAKANDALKRSLDALATDPELDRFLVHVLREIAQQVDLCTAYLFLYDPDSNTLTLRISLKDNQIHFGSLPDDPPLFSQPFSTDISPAWQYCLSHHKFIFQPVGAEDERTWDETKAWHVANGHSAHGGIALVAGNQPVGYLGMAWCGKESIAVEQAELIEALANQATLAIQLTQLAEEAKQAAQQSAILVERNRMARELHDTLAQTFTGIIMQLEATQQMITNTTSEPARKHLTHAGLLARQGLQEARRSVWSLRSEALNSHDLYMALLQMVQKMTEHTTLQTAVIVDGTPITLPSEIEDHLLRIGQESLTNALKYAQAQIIQIKLCFAIDAVELQILDDGQGFDPQQRRHGFGITCIQERTHQMGGDFTLTSHIGHGTTVNVRIPLA
jgi:signal transduction histidine kinase/PAS domain-containing protein